MTTLLSINNYFYPRGGAEVVFLEHGKLFEEAGWAVVPFCMQHPNNLSTEWSKYFIDELEFGGSYSAVQKIGMAAKVVYSFEARARLRALLATVRPKIAHAHNIYHHLSPSIFHELRAQQIPVVLTLHDLKLACPAYKMLKGDSICEQCKGGHLRNVIRNRCVKGSLALSGLVWLEATLHQQLGTYRNCVDRFVVPSAFYAQKLVEWGWPADRFVHIPNFIDPHRFTPEFEPGRYFLYFGRLSEEKGLATFVRAVAEAGVKGVVVGTGALEAELRELAHGVGADVEFAGYQTGTALHDYIRGARAVVLPSEWYENAPLSVMEAYALGKPVIGARIGGIPELIRNEQTGLTFGSGSVPELVAALRRVTDLEAGSLASMGREGRLWMETDFSATRYLASMRSLYQSLT